jgi:hypothetical protein
MSPPFGACISTSLSFVGWRVSSKDLVGVVSRSGFIGFLVKVVCLGCQPLVCGGEVGCDYSFLSYGYLIVCVVVDHCFPTRRAKYRFLGYPCGLLCDLK